MTRRDRFAGPPRQDDYHRYFNYADDGDREDDLFDTGFSTDFRYFARSRYDEEELQQLEQQDSMGWRGEVEETGEGEDKAGGQTTA